MKTWILTFLLAVLMGGAVLFALPYPSYCRQCFENNPAWLCYTAGCW